MVIRYGLRISSTQPMAKGWASVITWSLRKSPSLLTDALQRRPVAVMLSFGDPRPFADEIRAARAILICQCQDMDHVADAVDVAADVVVAQGAEAGGHGALRGTLSFVPEVADFLAKYAPNAVLLAAGGIADGRGLAAALMLGADGVLVGTRLWASKEALVKEGHHNAIIELNGDGTLRTRVPDIARQIPWPRGSSRPHQFVAMLSPTVGTGAKNCLNRT